MDFCVGIIELLFLQKFDDRFDKLQIDIFARHVLLNSQHFLYYRLFVLS